MQADTSLSELRDLTAALDQPFGRNDIVLQ
jgi:hypothetical protein